MKQELNFSALKNQSTSRRMYHALRRALRSKRALIVILLLGVGAALNITEQNIILRADALSENPLFITIVYGLLIYTGLAIYYSYRLDYENLVQFAKDNNFSVRKFNDKDVIPYCMSYGIDTSQYLKSGVVGMDLDGVHWDMFTLQNDNRSLLKFTIFRTKINESIPPMVLDSHNPIGNITVSPSWHRIELEGNFNQYFSLYIPKGSHINVLSYMAPDLMELVKNEHKFGDMEIANGWLFLIANTDVRNPRHLSAYVGRLPNIYKYIQAQAK